MCRGYGKLGDGRSWDGLYIETDHYRIKTTLADPLMLRRVPAFVESAYKAYRNQLPGGQ